MIGDISWKMSKGVEVFEFYVVSFGWSDYEISVLEDLNLGLLFDKLMGDAVREICFVLIVEE